MKRSPKPNNLSPRVTGLGGIFFKARNPETLSKWYRDHLGIDITNNVALFTRGNPEDPRRTGHTVWSSTTMPLGKVNSLVPLPSVPSVVQPAPLMSCIHTIRWFPLSAT